MWSQLAAGVMNVWRRVILCTRAIVAHLFTRHLAPCYHHPSPRSPTHQLLSSINHEAFFETDLTELRKGRRATPKPRSNGPQAGVGFLKVHTHAKFAEKYMPNHRALSDTSGRRTVPTCVPTAVISNGVVRIDSGSTSRGDTLMSTSMSHWVKLQGSIAGPQPSRGVYHSSKC